MLEKRIIPPISSLHDGQIVLPEVSAAVERGAGYEREVTMHLKAAKESTRESIKKEVAKRCAEVQSRNQDLERRVKQLEFQLKKKYTGQTMNSTLNSASRAGVPEGSAEVG